MAALTALLAACSAAQQEPAVDEAPEFQAQENPGASGNFGSFGGLGPAGAGETLEERQERDLELREDGVVR
ncbi:MAG: hypothetical protein AAF414_09420 [Pseudomonadota bacterium]